MVKLVDTRDLKSLGLWLYRFESGSGHQSILSAVKRLFSRYQCPSIQFYRWPKLPGLIKMTDTCDVSAFLMSLELEQLESIKLKLEQTIQQQQEERERLLQEQKNRPKIPPTFHDLDALAANTGLDLSGLIKDIKRRS